MHKYQVVIYWCHEDEVFVAEVPELSGCIAEGPTQETALAAVDDEVAAWLESARADDYPIPEPLGHVKVRQGGRGARRHERIEKRRRNRQQARQDRRRDEE